MTAILVRGALQRQVPRHPHKPSSHRLGARPVPNPSECDLPGCHRRGMPCWLPDDLDQPSEHLCAEHAGEAGYCMGCGSFSAGIEEYDFGRYPGFCPNCQSEMAHEDDRELRELRGDDDDDEYDDLYEDVP